MPLPGAVRLLPVSLFALVGVASFTVGAPLIPDALNGFGTATTFHVQGGGLAIEGGLYHWNDACTQCRIVIQLSDGDFVVSDSEGFARLLPPGLYELREYRGLFLFSQAGRHDFAVELHGAGQVLRLG